MTEVTKEDLDRMVKDIKEHIDVRLLPIRKEIGDHELILRGKNKVNGLIGDVLDIKTGGKLLKWFAGIGGLSGITAWISQWWRDMDR